MKLSYLLPDALSTNEFCTSGTQMACITLKLNVDLALTTKNFYVDLAEIAMKVNVDCAEYEHKSRENTIASAYSIHSKHEQCNDHVDNVVSPLFALTTAVG